jgi:sn-glycerol 3-phosphate transport system ATP-binding protein
MAHVELRQVKKRYVDTDVIHGIDMQIGDGEFVVIVGPSGCGKSTLLRMVAGLEEITGGEVAIDGRVVNNLEPKDRDIAMVFQNYALYPHMSVYENMAYGLKIRGMDKAEIGQRVDKAAKILELGALLERKPRQLSGGQRQRVAMGRAIVREPKVFLFDEPLSNLDAKLRVQMRLEIQKLHRELRTTSLYVTHDQVEAMTLAQRMIVMNAGRAEQIGTPADVYGNPETTFVASFIGSPPMNLVRGTVAADGRSLEVAGGQRIALPEAMPQFSGRDLLLGVRPEHLYPSETGFPIVVEMVEVLGAEMLIHGKAGAEAVIARLPDGAHPDFGETMKLGFIASKVHWFDPADRQAHRAVKHDDRAWPYPRFVAHRGGGWLAPENTLAAMRVGYAHGYRMVEIDVRLSGDGTLVLMHDDTVNRTTNGIGRVGGMTWGELARLDAGYGSRERTPQFAGEPIPSFEAIARWCLANNVSLNIEIKPCPGREVETGCAVALDARRLWRHAEVPPLFSSFKRGGAGRRALGHAGLSARAAAGQADRRLAGTARAPGLRGAGCQLPRTDARDRLQCAPARLPRRDLHAERSASRRHAARVGRRLHHHRCDRPDRPALSASRSISTGTPLIRRCEFPTKLRKSLYFHG